MFQKQFQVEHNEFSWNQLQVNPMTNTLESFKWKPSDPITEYFKQQNANM